MCPVAVDFYKSHLNLPRSLNVGCLISFSPAFHPQTEETRAFEIELYGGTPILKAWNLINAFSFTFLPDCHLRATTHLLLMNWINFFEKKFFLLEAKVSEIDKWKKKQLFEFLFSCMYQKSQNISVNLYIWNTEKVLEIHINFLNNLFQINTHLNLNHWSTIFIRIGRSEINYKILSFESMLILIQFKDMGSFIFELYGVNFVYKFLVSYWRK